MRFLVDSNVQGREYLTALGAQFDLVFVADYAQGLNAIEAIAALARREQRILITNDINKYRGAYERYPHHPGVVELETNHRAHVAGHALLELIYLFREMGLEHATLSLRDAAIAILIDPKGEPHFDLFDRFP